MVNTATMEGCGRLESIEGTGTLAPQANNTSTVLVWNQNKRQAQWDQSGKK